MTRRIILSTASFLCTFAFIAQTEAANRYWVGTDNRWEKTANWAATSGGAGGQTVPTSSDIAIFDGGGSSDALARSALNVSGILFASTTSKTLTLGTGSLKVGTSGFRIGNGTFKATGKTVSVAGNFTQTGGYAIEMSGILSVSGSLSLTGVGSAFAASGTIIFSGNSNQNFIVDEDIYATLGSFIVRNTGSSGDNSVIIDCNNFASDVCGFGEEGKYRSDATVTTGDLDLDSDGTVLLLFDGNLTVADSASASVNIGDNGSLALSGSILTGDAGNIIFGDGGITLAGTGTNTLDINTRN
jgi:hypothetical protein